MIYKLGSLFDGSGGFPLAGSLYGIEPVWAAEVEPYPIAVTRSRFPKMKHLGNICNINGAEIEPVDIITFGSPCQDLSVAGKRAGLKHEDNGDEETTRSGLFMEAVRIIKEMRGATNGRYPRFALWENVPGAFSSNQGEDFRVVLEELIKIAEPKAKVPPAPKSGWSYADIYLGDGWSLAYRVFDAQYWGVPQRRRRIHLIADFGGECAGEILFKSEGLRGYFAEGRTPWQGTAHDAESGIGATDREGNCVNILNPWDSQGNQVHDSTGNNIYPCLRGCGGAGYQTGYVLVRDNDQPLDAVGADLYNLAITGEKAATISANSCVTATRNGPSVIAIDQQGGKGGANYAVDVMPTICSDSHGTPHAVAYSFDSLASNSMKSKNPHSGCRAVEVAKTLDTTSPDPSKNQGGIAIVEPIAFTQNQRDEVRVLGGISGSLSAERGTHQQTFIAEKLVLDDQGGQQINVRADGKRPTLRAEMHGNVPCVMESMGFDMYNQQSTGDVSRTLKTPVGGDDLPVVCYGVDCRNMNETPELYPTLQAKPNGGQSLNFSRAVRVRYIVRRLTPTECARLQGFPDWWGIPDRKDDFADEEYAFWTKVRATHAVINGKEPKTYSKEQMLKWYNGLHTDSAEYKMWGNGIALPPAMFCMQNLVGVMKKLEECG